MATDLVLLTGGTGHLGFCTLLHALHCGHRVRAAVRSEAKASFLLSRPQIQALPLAARARLTFAVVPDITAPGAYDDAVHGVTQIIHIASPLVTGDRVPPEQHVEYFIRPAVRGTIGILEAAKAARSVRRVVITSSVVALLPVEEMEGLRPRTTGPVRATDRVDFSPEPYDSEFGCYAASKTAALNESESWMARERPGFDVVYLHPSFVQGRNLLAQTPAEAMRGTNAVVLAMLLGKRWRGFAGATVHVEDVAACHVRALDEARVPGGRGYILDTKSTWDDAKEVVARKFPEAVERKILTANGTTPTFDVRFDTRETEEVFGIRFQSFEDQVVSVVDHFLELRARKMGSAFRGEGKSLGGVATTAEVRVTG